MPKIIDHDQRRLEIVESTMELIVAGGFQAATMREIAAAAGYANGALKRYFVGKDDILMATSKHVSTLLVQRLERSVEGLSGMAAVNEIFEQTMPNMPENQALARVLFTFWERSIGNPELRTMFREELLPWRRMLEKYLHQALASGELASPLAPEVIADELLTQMVGAHAMVRVNPGEEYGLRQVGHIRRRIDELQVPIVPNEAEVVN